MLIDSHCHIHDRQYDFDPKLTLARARQNQVEKVVVIGTNCADSRVAFEFAKAHAPAFWTFGVHPGEYRGEKLSEIKDSFKELLALDQESPKLVAIGEIGLDYHYPHDKSAQIRLLEYLLQLAQDFSLPVVFHVREAFDDFWPILDNFHLVPSVLHSFSDNRANLDIALKHNLFIGVNGLATFANIPLPPLEKIILETDAPYLTPKPFRGKINEPSYIKNIAEWVAGKFNVSTSRVAEITTQNAEKLYKL